MAREYQNKEQRRYILPYEVYMQTLWCIRDYHRLKDMGSVKAMAIDKALDKIPPCYRAGIMNNIIFRDRYLECAHENTWKRYKQRFVYYAAIGLGIFGGDLNEG